MKRLLRVARAAAPRSRRSFSAASVSAAFPWRSRSGKRASTKTALTQNKKLRGTSRGQAEAMNRQVSQRCPKKMPTRPSDESTGQLRRDTRTTQTCQKRPGRCQKVSQEDAKMTLWDVQKRVPKWHQKRSKNDPLGGPKKAPKTSL